MRNLTYNDLTALSEFENDVCISIYIPTIKSGSETRKNSITFKNQVKAATHFLTENGYKSNEAKNLLEPMTDLIDDTIFWQKQQHGLAAFLTREEFLYYSLPIPMKEMAMVGQRFYLKPLIALFSENCEYYLLGLDLNNIRLYRCTRFSIDEIDLGDFPVSIKEAYADVEFERQVSFHTEGPRRAHGRDAHFFGRGAVGDEEIKESIYKYLKDVAGTFHGAVDRHDLPLIIAGVEYVIGIFREVNSYPYILEDWIGGSPVQMKIEDLHKSSWEIASSVVQKQLEEALQILFDKTGTGFTSESVEEIVRAAYNKRVDSIFFDPDYTINGSFNTGTQKISFDEDGNGSKEELINLAVIHTIKNKGTAITIKPGELPNNAPVAAMFRY